MIKIRFLQSLKLAIATGLFVIVIAFLSISCLNQIAIGNFNWFIYAKEIQQGEALIEKIESFRELHERVPIESEFLWFSKNLGFYKGEESCPCYSAITNYDYSISFPSGVGQSFVYESKTRQWQIHD